MTAERTGPHGRLTAKGETSDAMQGVKTVGTNLTRIGRRKAPEEDRKLAACTTTISDIDNLRAADDLPAKKASGEDGVTKSEYGQHLEDNLRDLSARLKRMGYRPGAKRRSYIPKAGSEKGRPLGISNLEDKIVEAAVKRTLEPIYEAVFEDSSYGYRPGRSQHMCLDALGRTIQQTRVNRIVEADIKGFFDTVNHEWMIKFLRHRIGDERVIRLIHRMLKSGILEGAVQCDRTRHTARLHSVAAAVEHLPALRVGPLGTPCASSARERRTFLLSLRGRFPGLLPVKGDVELFRQRLEDRLEGRTDDWPSRHCIEFGRCARECAKARRETEGIYLSRLHTLLWEDAGWIFQG